MFGLTGQRGQSRRGRQGATTSISIRHAHRIRICPGLYKYPQAAFPYELADRRVNRAHRTKDASGVRVARHRHLRSTTDTSMSIRRIRQGRAPTTWWCKHQRSPTAGRIAAPLRVLPTALVSQLPGFSNPARRIRRGLTLPPATHREGQVRHPCSRIHFSRRSASMLLAIGKPAPEEVLFTGNETNQERTFRRAQCRRPISQGRDRHVTA